MLFVLLIINVLKFVRNCSIIHLSEQSDVKGKIENSVKAGRLCHQIPAFKVRKGGGCYEKMHIKNYISNYCVFNNTYKKSKIAPISQIRAI